MRKTLVITDVTEMRGDEVCVAGIDEVGFCVRPVLRGGVLRRHLFNQGRAIVVPGRKVEFNLSDAKVEPPHVEDETLEPSSIRDRGRCSDADWEEVLASSCSAGVEEIFDGYLEGDRNVAPGSKTRSLGTIADVHVEYVSVGEISGRRRYGLSFREQGGRRYRDLPINDLTFRAGMGRSLDALGDGPSAEEAVLEALLNVERIYLRVGLTRPRQIGDRPDMCWTQITGVYTFPDYMEGKTFADFL